MDDLIQDIEAFCEAHKLRHSRFGREAVKDTSFVPQLKNGREPKRRTVERVRTFMASYQDGSQQQAAA